MAYETSHGITSPVLVKINDLNRDTTADYLSSRGTTQNQYYMSDYTHSYLRLNNY